MRDVIIHRGPDEAGLYCDGHAKWKKLEAQRSGDFGLKPDQLYTRTNGPNPDGGGSYTSNL